MNTADKHPELYQSCKFTEQLSLLGLSNGRRLLFGSSCWSKNLFFRRVFWKGQLCGKSHLGALLHHD